MEVLTTYVRENAPWRPQEAQPVPDGQDLEVQSPEMPTHASSTAEGLALRSTPTAIQAILTVIGRRTRSPNREGEYRLALDDTNLRSADLIDADLAGASLNGAHLERARLDGAHLEGARLHGADLKGASLHGADLQGARLNGADLQGVSLIN